MRVSQERQVEEAERKGGTRKVLAVGNSSSESARPLNLLVASAARSPYEGMSGGGP